MVQNEKVQNGSKWPKIVQHSPGWFRMVGNVGGFLDPKWFRIAKDGSE